MEKLLSVVDKIANLMQQIHKMIVHSVVFNGIWSCICQQKKKKKINHHEYKSNLIFIEILISYDAVDKNIERNYYFLVYSK